MSQHVVFSPDFSFTATDFVTAWNGLEACRKAAPASLSQDLVSKQFDPSLTDAGLALLGTVAVGVGTNALWDLIKLAIGQVLKQHNKPPQTIELMLVTQPDGTEIIVVKCSTP